MICAHIALFVYNRPDHTRKTIEALKQNTLAKDSELIFFPMQRSRKRKSRQCARCEDTFVKLIKLASRWKSKSRGCVIHKEC